MRLAWIAPDGDECRLVEILGKLTHPLPGFGSSDCVACVSHLLAWPAGVKLPRKWFGEEKEAVP